MKKILKIISVTVGLFIASTALATPYQCYNTYQGQNCGTDYVMSGLNCGAATAPGDPTASSVASWDAYCDGLTHGSGVNCLSTAYNAAYNAATCRCDTGWAGAACTVCASGYILVGSNCVAFDSHAIIYDNQTSGGSTAPKTLVSTVDTATGLDNQKISMWNNGVLRGLMDYSATSLFELYGTTADGTTNVIGFKDSDGASIAYINTDGDLFNSGEWDTLNVKTADTYGTSILTDGGLEVWTDANNLTNWGNAFGGVPGAATLTQESGVSNVYSGTYSAKFTTDAATDEGKYIYQEKTGLTAGDIYRLQFYAKESTSTGSFTILYLNGELGVATQVFHFTGASAGTWVNGTGAGGLVDAGGGDLGPETFDSQTLTNAFALKTASSNVSIPANGILSLALVAQGAGGVALDLYLDAISFQKVTSGVVANLFDLKSSQDPATYTSSDSVLKIENTGGAGKTWLQVKGDGALYVDGISTSGIALQGIESGSGNDIDITMGDDAGANVISFENLSGTEKLKINSLGNIYAPTNKTLIIGVENQGTADADGVGITIQADDAGSGGTGNHTGGNINLDVGTNQGASRVGKVNIQHNANPFGYLGSDTGGRLFIAGTLADSSSSAAVTIGADVDYATAGGKLVSFADTMGTGAAEKLYIGYDGAVRTPASVTAVFGATNQSAANNANGDDLYLLAGNAGSLTTGSFGGSIVIGAGDAKGSGNNVGGSIILDVGIPTGTSSAGSVLFTQGGSTYGFINKHPLAATPILYGNTTDGASAVGFVIGAAQNLTTAGAKLVSFYNYVGGGESAVEKAYVDYQGTLQNDGGRIVNVTNVNAATYDLLTSDYFLSVSYTTTGAVTSLTLPTAQCVDGRTIVIKDPWNNAAVNNITIDTEGDEKIDLADTYVMNVNGQAINLTCYSSNWYIH